MRGTGYEEEFFVCRSCSLGVALLRHVECVGYAARHHQKRLVDEVHPLARVECHQIYKTALGVAECGVGMSMSLELIHIAITIEIERQFGSLFGCDATHITNIFRSFATSLFLTGSIESQADVAILRHTLTV